MIHQFKGEYFFLSNFWVESDGLTLEHRFQAAKTHEADQRSLILNAPTPAKSKYFGRMCALRSDWEEVKNDIMLYLLREKFEDQSLRLRLLATGAEVLLEGNTWGDRYWGVDLKTGEGQNVLGRMLMRVRSDIRLGD